ncbi:MAG: Spy/CpxP family protein refolding chaperone [Beijerinckiaceae bacterium]
MTDDTSTPVSATPQQPARRRFFRNRWFLAGAIVVTGLVGFGLGKATSHRGYDHAYRMSGEDGQARVQSGLQRVLGKIDATPEQREKITAIVRSAMLDLQPMRQSLRLSREKLTTTLKAETIDRAAIEQLRRQQLEMTEMLSRKMSEALVSAAEALTPSQRAQLVDRWQSRRWRG